MRDPYMYIIRDRMKEESVRVVAFKKFDPHDIYTYLVLGCRRFEPWAICYLPSISTE